MLVGEKSMELATKTASDDELTWIPVEKAIELPDRRGRPFKYIELIRFALSEMNSGKVFEASKVVKRFAREKYDEITRHYMRISEIGMACGLWLANMLRANYGLKVSVKSYKNFTSLYGITFLGITRHTARLERIEKIIGCDTIQDL